MKAEDQHLEKNGLIDLTLLKNMLSNDKKPSRIWVKNLIKQFISITKSEPNVLKVNQPVIIIGDIHGQFFDLLKIMSLFPSLDPTPKENLLFLGDYVDRGPQGLQVTLVIMALKVNSPQKVLLLRGNHQTRQMTQIMNFYQQCLDKYDQDVYFDIMDGFDALPLACIVNDNYFCVHGGITAIGESIEELQKLQRFEEVPLKGSICDLVWADPIQEEDGKIYSGDLFIPNYQRNCSIFFGNQHARNFLKKTKLITIIRAHQVQLQGYKQHMWPKWKDIPMVYTVFSAPNYCGSYNNLGAILTIQKSKFNIRQFKQSNPKYYVPSKFNAFNFTIKKMFQITNSIMLRLVKRWVAKYIPQLSHLPREQLLQMFIKSEKCKILEGQMSLAHIQLRQQQKKQQQQIDSDSIFRKSLEYFSETEKRPFYLNYKAQ